jgi:hypothetical protein
MSQGMNLVLFVLGGGILSSLTLMRLISSLLFGVSPLDPLSLAAATFTLAALACFLPVRRVE